MREKKRERQGQEKEMIAYYMDLWHHCFIK